DRFVRYFREVDSERGSMRLLAEGPDEAPVLLDNPEYRRQPQTHVSSAGLRRIERLENVIQRLGVHSDSGVDPRQHRVTWRPVRSPPGSAESDATGRDP